MTAEELRIENINRCLDYAFGYCQAHGIDMKEMDRKLLNDVIYEFSNEAGIPDKHQQHAFAHLVCEMNGNHSQFLEPKTNKKHMKMKEPKPMLPVEIQHLNTRADERDEPTQRGKVKPYFSPQMKMNMKGGRNG